MRDPVLPRISLQFKSDTFGPPSKWRWVSCLNAILHNSKATKSREPFVNCLPSLPCLTILLSDEIRNSEVPKQNTFSEFAAWRSCVWNEQSISESCSSSRQLCLGPPTKCSVWDASCGLMQPVWSSGQPQSCQKKLGTQKEMQGIFYYCIRTSKQCAVH